MTATIKKKKKRVALDPYYIGPVKKNKNTQKKCLSISSKDKGWRAAAMQSDATTWWRCDLVRRCNDVVVMRPDAVVV